MKKLFLHIVFLLLLALPALAAYQYDGTGDNHAVQNPNVGDTDTFTYCFWIFDTSFAGGEEIIGYGNGRDSNAARGVQFTTNSGGTIRVNHGDGATTFAATSTNTLSTSTWHHVCWTRNGNADNKWWFDATNATADETESIDPPVSANSTDDFYAAGLTPEYTGFGYTLLTGRLAHVAYWNVVLTGAEIASLADKSTCPSSVQSSALKVFLKLTATPVIDSALGTTVVENGNPALESNAPPSLPSCGGAAAPKSFGLLGVGK